METKHLILTDCNIILKKNRLEESFFYCHEVKHKNVYENLSLPQEELTHLTKVFRAQKGDHFLLTDGCGRLFKAELNEFSKKSNQITLLELLKEEPKPVGFHIKIGFLKGKDLEEVVDTCCQAQPLSIQPLWTQFTQESPQKDHSKLMMRLETKAITGLKQSKSLWKTEILEPVDFDSALKGDGLEDRLHILLDMQGERHLSSETLEQMKACDSQLWFGPEGGLSEEEMSMILKLPKTQSLNLGDFRLRAITAPIFTLGFLAGLGSAETED